MPVWLHQMGFVWWSNVVLNTGRYALFAVLTWALLWVVLKIPLRGRKIREQNPSAAQMAKEFLFSLRSIAVFGATAAGMNLLAHAGVYPLSHLARQWGTPWLWTSLVLMILGHDAYFYWTHRAMHQPRLFRKFHGRHHLSRNPSPFTAYSFDLREAAVMASFVALWPLICPTPWPVVPLFVLHQIVRNTLLHCGYELMPARSDGRPLFDWLTTTTHHDLHHGQGGSNFGLYFTWWDRWMGTENPDYHAAFARTTRGRRSEKTELALAEA
jgi:sterol desaturase/sphingolipid hydroxylase (fatty acid hydroxylase superfamily)